MVTSHIKILCRDLERKMFGYCLKTRVVCTVLCLLEWMIVILRILLSDSGESLILNPTMSLDQTQQMLCMSHVVFFNTLVEALSGENRDWKEALVF